MLPSLKADTHTHTHTHTQRHTHTVLPAKWWLIIGNWSKFYSVQASHTHRHTHIHTLTHTDTHTHTQTDTHTHTHTHTQTDTIPPHHQHSPNLLHLPSFLPSSSSFASSLCSPHFSLMLLNTLFPLLCSFLLPPSSIHLSFPFLSARGYWPCSVWESVRAAPNLMAGVISPLNRAVLLAQRAACDRHAPVPLCTDTTSVFSCTCVCVSAINHAWRLLWVWKRWMDARRRKWTTARNGRCSKAEAGTCAEEAEEAAEIKDVGRWKNERGEQEGGETQHFH